MTRRKPLDEACTGADDCAIAGHLILRGGGHVRRRWGHIDLTAGQRTTLLERQSTALRDRRGDVAGYFPDCPRVKHDPLDCPGNGPEDHDPSRSTSIASEVER